MVHTLVADDNGVCLAQARFTTLPVDRVHVLAMIGYTQYIDRVMPVEEARETYRNLTAQGWTVPFKTPVLEERALRSHIHG